MNEKLYLFLLRHLTPYKRVKAVFDYDLEKKELLIKCPGCNTDGTDQFNDFGYIDRYGFHVRSTWCKRCGLIFINPRMSPSDYDSLYEKGHYRNILSAYRGKVKRDQNQIPRRLEPFKRLLPDYFPDSNKTTVLDIGGTKVVFDFLNNALNIEKYICINPASTEINIKEDMNFKVFEGSIENFPEGKDNFDLICLFGTLNHLLGPHAVFQKISTLLKDDGLFVLDHVNRVAKMYMASHPMAQIQVDHPIYPGTDTLNFLLNRAGLSVVEKHDNLPGTSCYFIKKSSRAQSVSIRESYLKQIKELSKRMKSVPVKPVIKNILKEHIS